ncbi:MAG TPA: tetratricopeptide repeat protein [Ruminiclostridium sp.]|nr:tetratricopeptide repeat protein [Ruminiclostridium sp.]
MAENRHHDYYYKIAQLPETEWKLLESNLPQILIAWQRLTEGDSRIKGWARALDVFLSKRGYSTEYFDVMNRFKKQEIIEDDQDGQIWVLNKIGGEHLVLGDIDNAIKQLQLSYQLATKLGQKYAMADALSNLAGSYGLQQRWEDALYNYQEALSITKDFQVWGGRASVLNNIGGIYLAKYDYENAFEYYSKGLLESQKRKDRDSEISSLNGLVSVYLYKGDLSEATIFIQQAIEINQDVGNIYAEANSLERLGKLKFALKQYSEAFNAFQRAFMLREKSNDYFWAVMDLIEISYLNLELGNRQACIENLVTAHTLINCERNIGEWMSAVNSIGFAYHQLNEHEIALEIYTEILQKARQNNNLIMIALELNNIASIHRDRNNLSVAMEGYMEALKNCRAVNEAILEPRIMHNIGRILLLQQKYAQSITWFEQAVIGWEKNNDYNGLSDSYKYMLEVYQTTGNDIKVAEIQTKVSSLKTHSHQPVKVLQSLRI